MSRGVYERPDKFRQVIVRMPVEMHEQVKERAEVEDRSMSQTIRRAVRMYLEQGAVQ